MAALDHSPPLFAAGSVLLARAPDTGPERLSAAEREHLAGLPTDKRRQDWLLGRLAAKSAVRALIDLPWDAFSILPGPEGGPRLAGAGLDGFAVSLSHGHGRALAWARPTGEAGGLPGVDLELIRPRPDGTLRFYLHPEERAPVLALGAGEGERPGPRDRLSVLLWALKEAAFKALLPPRGVGLLDVRVTLLDSWEAGAGAARIEWRGPCAERAAALGVREVRAAWQLGDELALAWVEARGGRLP